MWKYLALLALWIPASGWAAMTTGTWVLEKSSLTYTVTHPLHVVHGTSHEAKGKCVCDKEGCHFLVGAAVKSFTSSDSNRDLHMIEITRGATNPMVVVRGTVLGPKGQNGVALDCEIEFAGKTKAYKSLVFQYTQVNPKTAQFIGVIPATLKDFEIPPPTLLGMPVKNNMPIQVEMTWVKE
jgi:hypothetical protein